jgi:hypothetical protein
MDRNGRVHVQPNSRKLRSQGDTVTWTGREGGTIEIDFPASKDGTPFAAGSHSHHGPKAKNVSSGPCIKPAQTPYRYTITYTVGSVSDTLDPQVDVDDNTPPNGKGGRKATPTRGGRKDAGKNKAAKKKKAAKKAGKAAKSTSRRGRTSPKSAGKKKR